MATEKKIKVFDVIKSPSALTVEQGELLYSEIINVLKNKEIVIIDFTNIESIITPFLNASIGRLYENYTSEDLKEHLKVINQPEGSNRKFNLVIKNAKNFYANKEEYRNVINKVLENE